MTLKVPWWLSPWAEVRRVRALNARFHEHDQDQMLRIGRLLNERDELQHKLQVKLDVEGSMSTVTPEVIFVGIPRGRGKRVWASRELDLVAFSMTGMGEGDPRWRVTAALGHALTVDGDSYSTILAQIERIWRNQDIEKRGQLTAGQKQIEGGRGSD